MSLGSSNYILKLIIDFSWFNVIVNSDHKRQNSLKDEKP